MFDNKLKEHNKYQSELKSKLDQKERLLQRIKDEQESHQSQKCDKDDCISSLQQKMREKETEIEGLNKKHEDTCIEFEANKKRIIEETETRLLRDHDAKMMKSEEGKNLMAKFKDSFIS